jgi:hypothetical protein
MTIGARRVKWVHLTPNLLFMDGMESVARIANAAAQSSAGNSQRDPPGIAPSNRLERFWSPFSKLLGLGRAWRSHTAHASSTGCLYTIHSPQSAATLRSHEGPICQSAKPNPHSQLLYCLAPFSPTFAGFIHTHHLLKSHSLVIKNVSCEGRQEMPDRNAARGQEPT